MAEIAADDLTVERIVSPRDKAIEIFRNMGEHFKVQIIEDLPGDEEITIYKQGEWMDLCRGPTCPAPANCRRLLTKVAGAYWRGDANNQQLQRIYGTAWANKKQLKAYLNRIAEAEKVTIASSVASLSYFTLVRMPPVRSLAPTRLDIVPAIAGIHARPAGGSGLCGGQHT